MRDSWPGKVFFFLMMWSLSLVCPTRRLLAVGLRWPTEQPSNAREASNQVITLLFLSDPFIVVFCLLPCWKMHTSPWALTSSKLSLIKRVSHHHLLCSASALPRPTPTRVTRVNQFFYRLSWLPCRVLLLLLLLLLLPKRWRADKA
jgi:hypothetical protein